ncbi:MAG: helix-turn-helix domain-containing protein [Acidobacteriota bacterium]
MTTHHHPLLLSEKEAAKLIGFSVRTLQKWRTEGGGPPFIHVSARAIRYQVTDIEAWIEGRRRTSTTDDGNAA